MRPALSRDGSTLYFQAAGGWGGLAKNDSWQVKFNLIVDFNSDEVIDIADLVVLIEHSGEDNPSYDIGPLPLGDIIVDEVDLEILMSHWRQEAYDPTLIAHRALDAAKGTIAADNVGEDGYTDDVSRAI